MSQYLGQVRIVDKAKIDANASVGTISVKGVDGKPLVSKTDFDALAARVAALEKALPQKDS